MTAIRKSYLIAIEDPASGFGSGVAKDNKWYTVPQGFYMSTGGSTQAQSLYGTGAKLRQNSIYGAFQGSWNASFVMDYDHLEFFSIIFDGEDETYNASTKPYGANTEVTVRGTTCYDHKFMKLNNRRQQSYVIKERILNKIAGGEYDETNTYKGVLARNLQLQRSTSGSQMACEMSGVYSDKITELSNTGDWGTFFTTLDSPLTQYSCMYMGQNKNPEHADAIKQVDSHSIQIETSVSLVYSTCTPIAKDYFEDKTTFTWNASAYMNDPTKKFKLLSNSGGTMDPHTSSAFKDPDGHRALQPMGKNLAPLDWVNFITYTESDRDDWEQVYNNETDAFNNSKNRIVVKAHNSTVKTTTTPKGDGSKLQDTLSSVECDSIEIVIRNTKSKIWDESDKHTAESAAIADASFTSDGMTFTVPVSGYVGTVLGYVEIDQSETALPSSITLGVNNGYTTDLTGYKIISPTLQSATLDGVKYRLDNLVPKQLTAKGAGASGLTVTTDSVTAPTISGTPQVARTDYYFIVKDNGNSATSRYTTGYLQVVVK